MRKIGLALAVAALTVTVGFGRAPQRTAPHHTAPARHSLLNPASLNENAPATYRAKFETTQGDFVVEVTRAWAPLGADRFYNLVKYGFFNGARFFRVLPGFVVQFGLSPNPRYNAVWGKAALKDDPVTQSNLTGSLTFATAGPNTRTTQVFVNLADNTRLDGMGFAPFGKVVEGIGVVQKLYSGYGEGAPQGNGPDQGQIEKEGETYLAKGFPKLDKIKLATIVTTSPSTKSPVHHAAITPKKPN
jgi:peptidyl-prolyl cis-trans isomerase A (cyclophilin A)